MSLLVVGSIALDTVKTPVEEHSDLLGGSACYAGLGASFFSPVRLVGVVGDDFPESEFQFWKSRKIESEGVQRVNGKTFRWSGEYSWDLNTREMTKDTSLITAGRRIRKMGPEYVAIKKGEHGALLFGDGDQFFSCGAYPLEDIHDPTGAGDTFAGGMAGYLGGTVKKVHFNDLRKAMIYGSVLASFCVEAFSLDRLRTLSMEEVAKRYETFKLMSQFEVPV